MGGERASFWHSGRIAPVGLAAICAATYLVAAWSTADIPPLRPDTASYLYFDPSRPIGYPAFLWLADLLGNPALAVPVQMLLLALATFLLAMAFHRWSGSLALAALLQLALAASPEMWKFSATLITEGPATAAVALWCAQLLRMLRRPSLEGVGLLALISALAMLLKPSLVVMFVAAGVAVLLLPARRARAIGLLIVGSGLGLALIVTPLANAILHGSPDSGSPLARGVLQHTLFCQPTTVPADADSLFVERHAKVVRDYIAGAPDETHQALKRIYTGKLRFGLIIPAIGARHGFESNWQTDDIIWRIARERVAANPACYTRSVIGSYFDLITYDSNTKAESRRLAQALAARPPVDTPLAAPLPRDEQLAEQAAREVGAPEARFQGRQDFEPPTGRPLLLVWLARLAYGGAAVLGLAAILLLLMRLRLSPGTRAATVGAAAMALLFHGVLALTAIVELPLTRYNVAVWPVVCVIWAIVAVMAIRQLWPRLLSRSGA